MPDKRQSGDWRSREMPQGLKPCPDGSSRSELRMRWVALVQRAQHAAPLRSPEN
jgi:hypothetical protein